MLMDLHFLKNIVQSLMKDKSLFKHSNVLNKSHAHQINSKLEVYLISNWDKNLLYYVRVKLLHVMPNLKM